MKPEEQFMGSLRRIFAAALVSGDVPRERLLPEERKGEPYSLAFKVACTADRLAETCMDVWAKSDVRREERANRAEPDTARAQSGSSGY